MSRHLHAKTTPSRKRLDGPGAPEAARRLNLRVLPFGPRVNWGRGLHGALTEHSHTAWALSVELDAAKIYTDRISYGHMRRFDASWSANWAASSIGSGAGDQPL